jgi:hypothetical protein
MWMAQDLDWNPLDTRTNASTVGSKLTVDVLLGGFLSATITLLKPVLFQNYMDVVMNCVGISH